MLKMPQIFYYFFIIAVIFCHTGKLFAATTIKSTVPLKKAYQTANAPSLDVPLYNSLSPKSGVGSPTFTRADTFDYSATVTDWEDIIRPVLKNEARFTGARRVRNLLTNSNFSGTTGQSMAPISWVTTGVDPSSYTLVQETALPQSNYSVSIRKTSAGGYQGIQQGFVWQTNKTYIFSAYIRVPAGVSAPYVQLYLGTASPAVISVASTETLNAQPKDTWVRYSKSFTVSTSSSNIISIINPSTITGTGFDIAAPQLEIVEGQSNQNPSEYVSSGETNGPRKHGQTITDGVQYFATKNGNTVNGNNKVIEAVGAPLTPLNGASSITTDEYGPKGYLSEGVRVNAIKYSEQFDVSSAGAWARQNGQPSVVPDTTRAPSGVITADTIINTSATSPAYFYQWIPLTVASGSCVMFSVYSKSNYPSLISWGGISQVVGGVPTVVDVGNGWYRHILVGSSTVENPTTVIPQVTVSASSSVVIWGAQLEKSNHYLYKDGKASSYIPTGTSQTARAGDSLSYSTRENISNVSGSASIDVTPNWSGGYMWSAYFIDSLSSTQDLALWHWGGASNHLALDRDSSGDIRNNVDTACEQILTNSILKISGNWNEAKNNVFVNGKLCATRVLLNLPYKDLAGSLYVGKSHDSEMEAYSSLRNFKLWKKALNEAEMKNLTSVGRQLSQAATKKTTINVSQNSKNTTGLVGMWSFNGGSIKGKVAKDESGNGNDLYFVNNITPAPGKIGQAVESKKAGSFFISSTTSLDGTNFPQTAGTISVWIKADCSNQPNNDFLDEYNTNRRHIFIRCYSAASSSLGIALQNGGTYAASTVTAFKNNEWNHIVLIYNTISGQIIQYNNGVQVYSGMINDPTWVPDGQKIAPGSTFGDAAKGFIDEYRIYNRTLSQEEVTNLYKMGK